MRPPDWCWRRAVYLHDRGQPVLEGFDSALVEVAVRLVSQLVSTRSKAGQVEPRRPASRLARAHAIYAGLPPQKRSILEAWVLTGLPAKEIAARCGLEKQVVLIYQKVFFDVRDRLGARGYITHNVLDLWPRPAATLDNVLKRFGFIGGPVVLECLTDLFGVASSPSQAQLSLRDRLSLAAAVASFLLPVTPETATAMLRLKPLLAGQAWRYDPKLFREVVGRLVRLLRRTVQIVDEDLSRTFARVEDALAGPE
jgi:hypothetical protein